MGTKTIVAFFLALHLSGGSFAVYKLQEHLEIQGICRIIYRPDFSVESTEGANGGSGFILKMLPQAENPLSGGP
jgi:hypothetical protein